MANDGRPGDRDNYGADLEDVNGSMIARNTIVGNNRRNVLVGGDLSDVLVGGGGKDELDPGDVIASDCEKRFLVARVDALRHTARGSRVQAKVSCPKSATGPCCGTLRLVKGKKKLKVQMRVSVRGVAPAAGVRVTLRRR